MNVQALQNGEETCLGANAVFRADDCSQYFSENALISAGNEDETPWGGIADQCVSKDRHNAANGAGQARVVCDYSEGEESLNVWVIGDSHGQQWRQALLPLAAEKHWTLTFYTQGGCPTWNVPLATNGAGQPVSSLDQETCKDWGQPLQKVVTEAHPNLIFVGNFTSYEGISNGDGNSQEDQYKKAIETEATPWIENGTQVIVMHDTPTATDALGPACVEVSGTECVEDASKIIRADAQYDAAQSLGIDTINLNDLFCPNGKCYGVIGQIPVYYDGNHISRSFARSLAEPLKQEVQPLLEKTGNW